jgi:hypothetical protein
MRVAVLDQEGSDRFDVRERPAGYETHHVRIGVDRQHRLTVDVGLKQADRQTFGLDRQRDLHPAEANPDRYGRTSRCPGRSVVPWR